MATDVWRRFLTPRSWATIVKQLAMSGKLVRCQSSAVTTLDMPTNSQHRVTGAGLKCPFHQAMLKEDSRLSVETVGMETIEGEVRPYHEIPTPKGLPVIGTFWEFVKSGAMGNLHLYCIRRHEQLGPIYREKLGVVEGVFVADSQLIKKIYLNDGKYPRHLVPEPWIIYNETTGSKRGLFFMDGEEWGKTRKNLNQVFLVSSNTESRSDDFNDIVTDVLRRWKTIRHQNGELPDLEKELYKWTIESMGSMIFGRRLGCLEDKSNNIIQNFMTCMEDIFIESATMNVVPPKLAQVLNLPVWRRFVNAVTKALDSCRHFVEEAMVDNLKRGETIQSSNSVMNQLLFKDKIGHEAFIRIANDLLIAAAHTTSPASQWVFYLMAKYGDWQDEVYNEIRRVVPKGDIVRPEHLDSLPLVKAVVKESQRMYPIAPFLTRILSDDLILGNYHIPAGKLVLMSMFTTSRDPKYFPNPDQFNPSRWLRKENSRETIATHACLPFGLGARSCVGRRVAEVQMHLLLARAVQQFHIELANEEDIEIKLRMILAPSKNIRLKLSDRVV